MEITRVNDNALAALENYIRAGDMGKLTPEQRVSLYNGVCESLGLNPLTRPFEFIMLNGRLTLYARKDAAEQLRRIHSISIADLKVEVNEKAGVIIARATATTPDGRTDCDYGVVPLSGKEADFANAYLKAVTKAKRRVTLSLCGLGFLDETELETIPDVKPVDEKMLLQNGNTLLQEFSSRSIALATFLFDEQSYNATYKAQILKEAGLRNKKPNQFTNVDMEKYLSTMIRVWMREFVRLGEDEIQEKMAALSAKYPSLLYADLSSLKDDLGALIDIEYEVK